MRYSSGVTDTYAFDYFLERFDTLLTENEISHFFTISSGDVAEHLKSRHLQGGGFVIPIDRFINVRQDRFQSISINYVVIFIKFFVVWEENGIFR